MGRGAWWARVHGLQRVGHALSNQAQSTAPTKEAAEPEIRLVQLSTPGPGPRHQAGG